MAAAQLIRSEEKFPCTDGFSMDAYVVRPASGGRVPGVLFIFEVMGVNSEMKRVADELAADGFAVMMPNLFQRGSWFSCVRQFMRDIKAEKGGSVQDLLDARSWLVGRDYVDPGKLAVIGFCMGGGFAMVLGKTGLFQVSAPFYGMPPAQLDGLCPVVASYGGKDKMLLKDAERVKNELARLGIPHDFKLYPNAGHSFMNGAPNWFLGLVGKMINAGFEPESAADARSRVTHFFREHMGGSAQSASTAQN